MQGFLGTAETTKKTEIKSATRVQVTNIRCILAAVTVCMLIVKTMHMFIIMALKGAREFSFKFEACSELDQLCIATNKIYSKINDEENTADESVYKRRSPGEHQLIFSHN